MYRRRRPDQLEAIADADAEDPGVEINVAINGAAVDADVGVEEQFFDVEVGEPVARNVDIDAGLQCPAEAVVGDAWSAYLLVHQ